MQKGRTYIFDNSSLMVLGNYYPKSFQTLWDDMNELVVSGKIFSVKEVRKEIEKNCRFPHIEEWVKKNRKIFRKPSSKELDFISYMFLEEKNRELIKLKSIIDGLPVADPFVIASAKIHGAIAVTQESNKKGAARIPTICEKYDVQCINIEEFLGLENLIY